jgi:hypothetical protein
MMGEQNITRETLEAGNYRAIHAGDSYDLTINLTRGGVALDLTSANVWLTVKESALEVDADAKLFLLSGAEITISAPPTGGIIVVAFRGSGAAQKNTTDIEGLWLYDLQVKLSSGEIITAAWGKIEFLANITRATS